jgi:ATP adenylyltransferase/5',5'''-P-1,P-4-tetraphosphate phosphorylase II
MFATNTPEETISEISKRIEMLNAMSEADLKTEMTSLKQALKENPAACALMKDEDVGLLVTALRKLTNKAITETEKPKRGTAASKAPAVKKLTAAELAAALEDEDF